MIEPVGKGAERHPERIFLLQRIVGAHPPRMVGLIRQTQFHLQRRHRRLTAIIPSFRVGVRDEAELLDEVNHVFSVIARHLDLAVAHQSKACKIGVPIKKPAEGSILRGNRKRLGQRHFFRQLLLGGRTDRAGPLGMNVILHSLHVRKLRFTLGVFADNKTLGMHNKRQHQKQTN